MFKLTKFRQYVWGREFKAVTNHKPLLVLLAPEKPVPEICSPRVLHWSLMLAAYSYKLKYRPGSRIANGDCLSRLPLPVSEHTVEQPTDAIMLKTAYPKAMTPYVVAEATSKDLVLAKVREALWAAKELPEPALKLY